MIVDNPLNQDSSDGLFVEASIRQRRRRRRPWFVNQSVIAIQAAPPPTLLVGLEGMMPPREKLEFLQVESHIYLRNPGFYFFCLIAR